MHTTVVRDVQPCSDSLLTLNPTTFTTFCHKTGSVSFFFVLVALVACIINPFTTRYIYTVVQCITSFYAFRSSIHVHISHASLSPFLNSHTTHMFIPLAQLVAPDLSPRPGSTPLHTPSLLTDSAGLSTNTAPYSEHKEPAINYKCFCCLLMCRHVQQSESRHAVSL